MRLTIKAFKTAFYFCEYSIGDCNHESQIVKNKNKLNKTGGRCKTFQRQSGQKEIQFDNVKPYSHWLKSALKKALSWTK